MIRKSSTEAPSPIPSTSGRVRGGTGRSPTTTSTRRRISSTAPTPRTTVGSPPTLPPPGAIPMTRRPGGRIAQWRTAVSMFKRCADQQNGAERKTYAISFVVYLTNIYTSGSKRSLYHTCYLLKYRYKNKSHRSITIHLMIYFILFLFKIMNLKKKRKLLLNS